MEKTYNLKMFEYNSDVILLNGNYPGEIFLYNEDVAAVKAELDPEETMYTAADISTLLGKGLTFNNAANLPVKDALQSTWVKLYLNLSYACNLACDYCFVKNFDADKNLVMSTEEVRRVLELFQKSYPNLQAININFYGGEPLLQFGLIQEIVELAGDFERQAGIKFSFAMNTNGLLLDHAKMEYLIDHNIAVLISCDGPESTHNAARMEDTAEHTALLAIIKQYVSLLREKGKSDKRLLIINATVQNDQVPFKEICDFFLRMGVKYVTFGPIIGHKEDDLVYQGEDFIAMKAKYEQLFQEALEDIRNGVFYKKVNAHYHRFRERIFTLINPDSTKYKFFPGCRAGSQHFTISPTGEVYFCPVVQTAEHSLGDLTALNVEKIKSFHRLSVNHQEDCSKCWNKYFCGGGCYAMNHFLCGDIGRHDSGFCELDRFITEKAIYLFYEIIMSGDRSFHDFIIASHMIK